MSSITCGDLTLTVSGGCLSAALAGIPLTKEPLPLMEVWLEGQGEWAGSAMTWREKHDQVGDWELLSLTGTGGILGARVDLLAGAGEIRVSCTLTAAWPEGIPARATLHLPWLAGLHLPGGMERFPAKIWAKESGASALQMKKLCPPPYCLEDGTGRGLAAYFPLDAANLTWDPCRNIELCDVASREDMARHRLHLRLSDTPVLAADIRLWPLREGWRECFTRFRDIVRAKVPKGQYAREDLRWARELGLMHFTYAFSREFFDEKSGRPDLKRLLDAGEAFGGYDALLLWHEYPRLGLDARTQWDFYDDYPGGRDELRSLIAHAHARGVKVLLPFKPWDRSPLENDSQTTRRIAALIGELDVDGIFFDTMNTVPEAFRAAMDAVKPGVVFVTESEPHETRALEMITASWNQYRTDWPMPESNLIRFLFPQHARWGISRWHVGAQKDQAIERAIFNGEGMVIWQDIFGAWLPWSPAQQAEIRRWKALRRQWLPLLQTEDCVPLLTTLSPGVAANGFFAEDRAIITMYLDGDGPFDGPLLNRLPYATAREVRDGRPMTLRDGMLSGSLLGRRTAMVLLER